MPETDEVLLAEAIALEKSLQPPPPEPSKEQQMSLKVNTEGIWSVVTSPKDGQDDGVGGITFVTAGQDGKALIWTGDEKKPIGVLSEHTGPVLGVAFSPNGRILATSSFDNTVRLWVQTKRLEPEEGEMLTKDQRRRNAKLEKQGMWDCRAVLEGHTEDVNRVVFNHSGDVLATASNDNTLRIWTLDGKCRHVLKGHEDNVRDCCFSPNGKTLASASWDKYVKVWNVHRGECVQTMIGHKGYVWSVNYSPDGKYLVSGSWDCTARLWHISGKLLISVDQNDRVSAAIFVPQGDLFVSASQDCEIKIWTLTGRCVRTFVGHLEGINELCCTPSGKHMLSCSDDGVVKVWDLTLKEEKQKKGKLSIDVNAEPF